MKSESIIRLCAVTCHPESLDPGQAKASENSLAHRRNSRVSSTQHGYATHRGVLLFGSEPDLSLICLQPQLADSHLSSGGFFISTINFACNAKGIQRER